MRVLDFVDPEISNVFRDHQFINGLRYRIECYHHGADCLKFIHRYYLNTLGGPLQLVVVLVLIINLKALTNTTHKYTHTHTQIYTNTYTNNTHTSISNRVKDNLEHLLHTVQEIDKKPNCTCSTPN